MTVPVTGVRVALALDGVVARVTLALAEIRTTVGHRATIPLQILAQDADGNTILFGTTFSQPFTLTSSDPANGTLSQTAISRLNFPFFTVTYSGANVSSITFSAMGSGLRSVTPTILTPVALPSTGEQIIVTNPNSAFATFDNFQLLTTFGDPASYQDQSYRAPAVDDAARRLYIGHYLGDSVWHIDAFATNHAYALVDSFNPQVFVEGLAIDSSANRLYVTDDDTTNISIFSTMSGHRLLAKIHSGLGGASLAIDPVAHRLYAAGCQVEYGCTGLQVFSTLAPYGEIESLDNGGQYGALAVDHDTGKLFIVERNLPGGTPNYVDIRQRTL